MSVLRKNNITFTESDGTIKNHQGGDFLLEQKVKRMKMISPKGSTASSMWQRVARNVDQVGSIVEHGMGLLQINESDEYRVRHSCIDKEVVKWRAVLRNSKYLYVASDFVTNIHGVALNKHLTKFTEEMKVKRELYFQMACDEKLQHIRYECMKLHNEDLMAEIQPYCGITYDDEGLY